MNKNDMTLAEILSPFFDREAEFTQLLQELKKSQAPSDGSISPIVFLEGLTENQQAIVDSHFEHQEQQLYAQFNKDQSDSTIAPSTMCPIYGKPYVPSVIGHPAVKQLPRSFKPNCYQLMQKVLVNCCLRYYEGAFYCLTGSVYRPLSDDDIKALVFHILEEDIAEHGGTQILRQTLEHLSANPHIRPPCKTDCLEAVYFRNGCLNIRNGNFRGITPADFFTSYIDVDFPAGTQPVCPRFDDYLCTVSGGDPSIVETIWQLIGYLIVPDTAAKKFFVLYGVSDSGKSVLGDLLASLFNPEAVAFVDIFRFQDKFSFSAIHHCRLNISMDLPQGRIPKATVATIKQLTGGDGLSSEPKFKPIMAARSSCKMVFGTNHPLSLSEPDAAFENRIVIIPFHYAIPKEAQDPRLREKLKRELPAIVKKAIAAYWRLRRNNYQFAVTAVGNGSPAVCGYVPISDLLERFLAECSSFNAQSFTPTAALLVAFNSYCSAHQSQGIEDITQFSRQLNRYCNGQIKNRKKRLAGIPTNGYEGISLNEGFTHEVN